MDEREAGPGLALAVATFDSEAPVCPFRKCDMRTNHDVVGRGWDFEYASTHDEIELLQCRTCRLIFPREIPVEAALPVIYPKNYYSFSETKRPNALVMAVRGRMSRAKGQVYMDMVRKDEAQVIDIGCGDGRMLDVLRASCPSGWSFHGIDWSDDAVERVRRKGYDGRAGDVSRMDLSEWQGKFDLAIMHQLVEHVRDPRELLNKVKSMLKPGGILSVETPDIDAWDFRLLSKRYWAGYHIPRHFYIFDKKNFSELAQELGFEVVSTRSLVNPVFWIHSIQSYFADNKFLARFAKFFHHQNVLMLALFTPLEILQTRLSGTSSNMQINLRKVA
ncbi:MAG TPA: class I SAM-dependent methyltransferase [Polyangiaceae bacterium]|jgi:SAM-dependent methyltransferase